MSGCGVSGAGGATMKRVLHKLFDRRDWRASLLLSKVFIAAVAAIVAWAVVRALGGHRRRIPGKPRPVELAGLVPSN